jgi:hypothetical protein
MANTCITDVKIVGDSKQLHELYDIMNNLQNLPEPTIKNGWGKTWLGCLVEALDSSWQDTSCRGQWIGLDWNDDNTALEFTTESAWAPCIEVHELIEKRFPDLKVYYYAEEPGFELYETNDTEGAYFTGTVVVDIYTDGDSCTEYFDSDEAAFEFINAHAEQISGVTHVTNEDDVCKLDEELGDIDEDWGCSMHHIDVVTY